MIFALSNSYDKFDDQVTIALVGKYTILKDSYISVFKALKHAAFACGRQVNIYVSQHSYKIHHKRYCQPVTTNLHHFPCGSALKLITWNMK